ncbi:MAG TPA: rod shape-determining protein MreD [bacterium]|nr:rod shape-determining protein MreD [bacterium]
MKLLIVTACFLAAALVQSICADAFMIRRVSPDFLLIAVVFCSLRAGWQRGLLFGLIAGFICDVLSLGRMGLFAVSMGTCGLLLGFLTFRVYFENPLTQSLIALLVTLLNAAVYFSAADLFYQESLWYLFLNHVVPQSIYNFTVGVILFTFMHTYERKRLISLA